MNRIALSPARADRAGSPARKRLLRAVMMAAVALTRNGTTTPKLDEASIDYLARSARVLAPDHLDLRWLHALLLAHTGFVENAGRVAGDDPHPMSRVVRAWCAFTNGDDNWHALALGILDSGHAEACAMARILLDTAPETSPVIACDNASSVTWNYLQFHCRC